jgi:D-alanyl-D-alanine carboxypeptidase
MPNRPLPQKNTPKKNSRFPWKIAAALFVALVFIFAISPRLHNKDTSTGNSKEIFNKSQFSINDPSSIWAVVNKGRSLGANYIPADLIAPNIPLRLPATDPEMHVRSIAAPDLQQMYKDAKNQNINLMLSSGYRSYDLQNSVYASFVRAQGQKSTDSSSARPGHSEHQTGLAIDIEPANRNCEVELCFENTPEGKWLALNSYKYGFIIRYQKDKENITGYEYEPWHVRYVGKDLAAELHNNNQTLEQFFGLPVFSDYPKNSYILGSNR